VLSGLLFLAISLGANANEINPRFERLLPTEAQDIEYIKQGIGFLQAAEAKRGGEVLRGTHAKGICVKGNLEIFDLNQSSLPPEIAANLSRGMFSQAGKYNTIVRFANADGKKASDQEPDVRAISLAVDVPPYLSNAQGRMDFAMNDATTFPINDAHVFAEIMRFVMDGAGVEAIAKAAWRGTILEIKNANDLGNKQKHLPTMSYQRLDYWSDVPFQLGEFQAVKYELKHCSSNPAFSIGSSENALSEELRRHVNSSEDMSCFDFGIQILDVDKMRDPNGKPRSAQDWVENAALEWPADQSPFYPVGRLTLVRNSELPAAECEARKIDVNKNNNAIHKGLGSINRGRTAGEAVSADGRNAK